MVRKVHNEETTKIYKSSKSWTFINVHDLELLCYVGLIVLNQLINKEHFILMFFIL